jgi:hypothetical protein
MSKKTRDKDEKNADGKPDPDMSGSAVARRLKDVAQLFRLWCRLKHARVIEASGSQSRRNA